MHQGEENIKDKWGFFGICGVKKGRPIGRP